MHSISIDPEHLLCAKHFWDHSQAIPNSLGLDKQNKTKQITLLQSYPAIGAGFEPKTHNSELCTAGGAWFCQHSQVMHQVMG